MNLLTNKKGFTILEVLIAITLLAIGMMALATLQSSGIRGNDLGNRTTQALALAQDKLEELINADAIGQAIGAGTDNNIDETGSAGGIFSRSWLVQTDVPAPNEDTIVITVSWNDVIGQHNVTTSGVITSDSY
jgi:type IV pilus assembly protein PilV